MAVFGCCCHLHLWHNLQVNCVSFGVQTDHAADNIKVAVRVRPMFPQEEQKGAANILQVNEDCTAIKVG